MYSGKALRAVVLGLQELCDLSWGRCSLMMRAR